MIQQCSKCHGPLEKYRNHNKPEQWVCQKCQKLKNKNRNRQNYQDRTILKIKTKEL